MPRIIKKYLHDALLDIVCKHTEAPDRFITWTMFSAIGAVMKRKFYIRDGLYTIYPNQYVVLVAPPGIGKGTAINFVWNLIRQTSPNLIANIISDRVTAPRIIERIAKGWNSAPSLVGQQIIQGSLDHSCTLFSTELSILIGASDMMLDFLCEGWDRYEYDYDTKNSGSAFVKDMCTSLIAATVPDFIRNIDKSKDLTIKGGFTSRCLFIYEDQPARNMPFPPPIHTNKFSTQAIQNICSDLVHISTLPGGEMSYDAMARLSFENYINAIRMTKTEDIEAIAHFKSRIKAHILKLAMVIAISRDDTLVISRMDMDNAIAQVSIALKTLEKVFRGSGDSNEAMATARVQSYVENAGAASRKELLGALHRHMDFATLDRILYVMVEIGYFEAVTTGNKTMYRIFNTSPNGTAKAAAQKGTKNP